MANPANVANLANGARRTPSTIVDRFSIRVQIRAPLASLCTVAHLGTYTRCKPIYTIKNDSYQQAKINSHSPLREGNHYLQSGRFWDGSSPKNKTPGA